MAHFKVQMEQLGQYERVLGKAFRNEMAKALQAAGKAAIAIYQQGTRDAPPASVNGSKGAVSSGKFLRSWKRVPSGDPLVVHVANVAHYADEVEYGRRPGSAPPPVDAILKWMRKKSIAKPSGNIAARARGRAALRGIAYIIARAIGRRGLRGRFIMRTHESAVRARANATLDEAMRESMRKAIKGS